MASTWIKIDGNETRITAKLRTAVDRVRAARDEIGSLKNIVDEIATGNDWAALAAAFGFEAGAVSEAKAQTIYNLLVGTNTALAVSDVKALVNRVG